MSSRKVTPGLPSCAEISKCSAIDKAQCTLLRGHRKCWLKGKGCLCQKDPHLTCQGCAIYHGHFRNVLTIIGRARRNDGEAFDTIIKEYYSFVIAIAKKYYLPGGTRDDIHQEGLIGLYEAVLRFDPQLSHSFEKYASFCIRNSIIASLKKATQKRQKILTESASIHGSPNDEDCSKRFIKDNFESSLIMRLVLEKFFKTSIGNLSATEYKVLVAKMSGYSATDIRRMFRIGKKQIENAIYRARTKLRDFLDSTS